jgi:hypothetical protein
MTLNKGNKALRLLWEAPLSKIDPYATAGLRDLF